MPERLNPRKLTVLTIMAIGSFGIPSKPVIAASVPHPSIDNIIGQQQENEPACPHVLLQKPDSARFYSIATIGTGADIKLVYPGPENIVTAQAAAGVVADPNRRCYRNSSVYQINEGNNNGMNSVLAGQYQQVVVDGKIFYVSRVDHDDGSTFVLTGPVKLDDQKSANLEAEKLKKIQEKYLKGNFVLPTDLATEKDIEERSPLSIALALGILTITAYGLLWRLRHPVKKRVWRKNRGDISKLPGVPRKIIGILMYSLMAESLMIPLLVNKVDMVPAEDLKYIAALLAIIGGALGLFADARKK